jgi:hypothetical protein
VRCSGLAHENGPIMAETTFRFKRWLGLLNVVVLPNRMAIICAGSHVRRPGSMMTGNCIIFSGRMPRSVGAVPGAEVTHYRDKGPSVLGRRIPLLAQRRRFWVMAEVPAALLINRTI